VLHYEKRLKKQGFDLVIGVDEAGRGPLAGPVVAAAVTLKTHRFKNRIDDSKKLSHKQREGAFLEIIDKSVFGLGIVEEGVIDSINILEATRLAMQKAVDSLVDKVIFEKASANVFVLADGNMRLNFPYPYLSIIEGESKSQSIAAASIMAKVTRDRIMSLYDRIYPDYGFLKHKGYPTKLHRKLIAENGLSKIHRKTFCCV
jgi:ribonuclease HII